MLSRSQKKTCFSVAWRGTGNWVCTISRSNQTCISCKNHSSFVCFFVKAVSKTWTARTSGARELFSKRATFTIAKHRTTSNNKNDLYLKKHKKDLKEKLIGFFNKVFTGINFLILSICGNS